ncbi:YqaA family protein [Hallella multisaccharivorax]|uniref:YqaA family protein n=1 Tax=Hallella multisaccharivorax TaxID=310514 RepID=UPI00361FA979
MSQALTDFLLDYGYWGMLLAAFLAGSVFPFSSEAVMLGLLAAGLKPEPLIVYGTVGNVLGSLFNYGVGRLGRLDWIERYLHVKKANLDKAQRFMAGHGAWIGFFAFLPLIGSAITVCLGLMRANIVITTVSITVGKLLRYIVLVYGAGLLAS